MRAIQHDTNLVVPELDLVLPPGVEVPVTAKQADALRKLGVTILPDPKTAKTTED